MGCCDKLLANIKETSGIIEWGWGMPSNIKQIKASVGHLSIEVSNIKKSKKFYDALAEALDLKIICESNEAIGWGNNEFQIWIGLSKNTRVKREPPTGDEIVVAEHVAIYVHDNDSVDLVKETLLKAGISPLFPPEEHPEFSKGYYSASYCDPENYVIEIFTAPNL